MRRGGRDAAAGGIRPRLHVRCARPCRLLEAAVLDRRHPPWRPPDPALADHNVAIEMDPAANRKPSKKRATGHIDGVVALMMAMGAASPPVPKIDIEAIDRVSDEQVALQHPAMAAAAAAEAAGEPALRGLPPVRPYRAGQRGRPPDPHQCRRRSVSRAGGARLALHPLPQHQDAGRADRPSQTG